MATITSLQKAEKFEIEKYKAPKDVRSLYKTHVPYTGSPQKHPLDPDQIILCGKTRPHRQHGRGNRLHGQDLGQERQYRRAVHAVSGGVAVTSFPSDTPNTTFPVG
jgi:hypothetical protein